MSIAMWQEIETLKKRVQQLEDRRDSGVATAIMRLSERMTELEHQPQRRKPGPKPKDHPQ